MHTISAHRESWPYGSARKDPSLPDFERADRLKAEFLLHVMKLRNLEQKLSALAYDIDQAEHPSVNPSDIRARKAADKRTAQELAFIAKTTITEAEQWLKNGRLVAQRKAYLRAKESGTRPNPEIQSIEGLLDLAEAIQEGSLSSSQATVIEDALRRPDLNLSSQDQTMIIKDLLIDAEASGISQLKRKANNKAVEQGTVTPREREEAVRWRRYINIGTLKEGMHSIHGMLTPEAAATFQAITGQANNPARFEHQTKNMTKIEQKKFEQLTPGARAHDAIFEYLTAAIEGDPDRVPFRDLGVTVVVNIDQLKKCNGTAWYEDTGIQIPIQAAERIMCDAGFEVATMGNNGHILNLGRTQRLFSRAQKRSLALRDGGCRWPNCDRPISMTEAHHIVPWQQGGVTDLENGILLCGKHHRQLHNSGYSIQRTSTSQDSGSEFPNDASSPQNFMPESLQYNTLEPGNVTQTDYWLHPPDIRGRKQDPIPMQTQSPWQNLVKATTSAELLTQC